MTWKENLKEAYNIHSERMINDPNWTARKTAEKLNITPKRIHMILDLYPFLSDPEISSASGLHSAYLILLRRKREKKNELMKELLAPITKREFVNSSEV